MKIEVKGCTQLTEKREPFLKQGLISWIWCLGVALTLGVAFSYGCVRKLPLTPYNHTAVIIQLTLFLLKDFFSRLREDMGFCFCFGTDVGVHPDLLAASNY